MLHLVGGVGVGRPLGGKGQRGLSHGLGDGLIPAGEGIAHACDRGCRNGFAIGTGGGRSAHATIGVPRDLMGVVEEGQLIGNTVRDTLHGLAVQHDRHGLAVQHGDIRMRRVLQLHTCLPCHGQHQLHLLAAGSIFEGHLRLIAHLHGGDLPVSKQYCQEIDRRKLHSRIVLIDEPRLHVITVQRQLRNLLSFDQQLFVGRHHSTCHVLLQCGDGRICNSGHKGVVKALILTLIFTPLVAVHLLIVAPGNTELFTGEVISHGYQQIQIAAPLGRNGQIPIRHGSGDLPIPAVETVPLFLRSFGQSNGITIVFLLRMIYLARLVNNEFQRIQDMLPLCFQRHGTVGLRRQVADSLAVRIGGIAQFPSREAPARPGKAVGCESLLLVISEALVSHAALAAAGVEFHRVCVGAEAAGDGHVVVRHGEFAVHRLCTTHLPAAERIAGLGRISLHCHSRAVIDGRLALHLAVQHVRQAVLMNLGGCRKGQVPRGHLLGNNRVPRRHIVACLRVGIGGNVLAVGHALGLHRLAVHLIGDGIGVDAPARRQSLVFRDSHGSAALHLRLAIKPTLKRIALLRRSGQSRILAVIGDGNLLACTAAVGIELHRVCVDRPLGGQGLVCGGFDNRASRHLCTAIVPSVKGIPRAGGGGQIGIFTVIGNGDVLTFAAAVGIELHRVLARAEAASDGHIVVRHGEFAVLSRCAFHLPAAERIAGLGRRIFHPHSLAVIDGFGGLLAVQHVLQRMGIHLPHGFIAPVASAAYSDDRRHFRGGTALPTLEGVSLPAGSRQLDFPALHRVAGRIALGIGTAVQLIADGVGNRRRGGIEVHLSRRHSGGRLAAIALRPLRHGIAGLGVGIQLVQTGTELPCVVDILQYLVIYGVGDGIRHNAPVRRQLFVAGSAVERGIVDERIVIIPAGEGIALLCRLWQGAVGPIVGDRHAVTRTAAIRVKRHRVLIGRPLRRDGHILRWHVRRNILIPTGEGVPLFGGVCGCGDLRAVVLCDGRDRTAAVRVERDRVLVDRPLRREGHVMRRQGHVGRIALPALEGIALLGGLFGLGDGAAIIHFSILDNHVTVLERHRVLVDRPLRLDGHILRGHVRRNILIPTGEGVPLFGGVCGCGDVRAVVLRNRRDLTAAVRVERDRVLVDRPLRLDGHIPRWHGGGDLLAPPRKGIPCFGGVCGLGDSRAIVLRDGLNLAAAVRIERDRVLVCRPVGGIFPVSGGIFDGDSLLRSTDVRAAPTGEGIALLGGVLEGKVALHRVAVGIALDRAAVQVVGDTVVDHLPLRLNGHVLCGHGLGNLLVPAPEGIPRLGGIRAGLGDVRAELDGAVGIAGGALLPAVKVPRQLVAIAGVVDPYHRAAVGCDGRLRDRPGGESRIGFGCGGCLGTGGAGLGLRFVEGIAVIRKVLPVMLHLIGGVGVGRPPGGQSQALLRHGGVGKLCIAVVPPGEGIAGLGGGGESQRLAPCHGHILNGIASIGIKGDGVLVLFPSIHIVDPPACVAAKGRGDELEGQLTDRIAAILTITILAVSVGLLGGHGKHCIRTPADILRVTAAYHGTGKGAVDSQRTVIRQLQCRRRAVSRILRAISIFHILKLVIEHHGLAFVDSEVGLAGGHGDAGHELEILGEGIFAGFQHEIIDTVERIDKLCRS